MMPDVGRRVFSEEEDLILIEIVEKDLLESWIEIAKIFGNKTERQCRDRWLNFLSPCIRMRTWTFNEEVKLIKLVKKFGCNNWPKIASYFPNKDENSIKNKWRDIIHKNVNKHQKSYRSFLSRDDPDDVKDGLWQEREDGGKKRAKKSGENKKTTNNKKINSSQLKKPMSLPIKSVEAVPEQQPVFIAEIPPNQPETNKEEIQSNDGHESIFDEYLMNDQSDQYLDDYVF